MHETPQPEILGYAASFLYAAAAVFYILGKIVQLLFSKFSRQYVWRATAVVQGGVHC